MYEENRRFSWTGLFLKIIIIIIFILFTVWLLSLSNKGMSNSINVLTDNIFAENISKMKEVGKDYFTTERLPEKVGDVKTLTLEKMYEKKLLLELRDKKGNACSAKNSYVSIEKMDNEYQMKVYLECGEESNYVVVIMGCYNYCDSDICEKQIDEKEIEYEYKKTIGGSWTNWGAWSNWSKDSISKNNYRDVETKVVKENYTGTTSVTSTKYVADATCPTVSGYTLSSSKNGVCNYYASYYDYENPKCPTVSGYTLSGRNGFTCTYVTDIVVAADPVCPSVTGYTLSGRNGFTCSYSKTSSTTSDPVCPSVTGYTYAGRNGFTCSYSKAVKGDTYTLSYYTSGSGSYVPADTDELHYKQTSADYIYKCNSSCAFGWYYTYDVYKKNYSTTTSTITKTATCPTGYTQSGNACTASTTSTITKTATCPTGYTQSGNTCYAVVASTVNKVATCPTGYTKSGNTCVSTVTTTTTKNATCPSGQTIKSGKCYKDVTSTVPTTGSKDVTYYRYRTRSYIGGKEDYKWSLSDNDQTLIKDGYVLTGKTREVEKKKGESK